jgi:hypothetical protein
MTDTGREGPAVGPSSTAEQPSGPAGRTAAAGLGEEALLVAAGVADLVVSGVGTVLKAVDEVVRRGDLTGLVGDGREEVKARGRLVWERAGGVAGEPPHLEVLARRVAAARGGEHGRG